MSDDRSTPDWQSQPCPKCGRLRSEAPGFVECGIFHAVSPAAGPTPEEIAEEVEAARKHLYTALGAITVLTGYSPDFPAIGGHIKKALAMLPKRSAKVASER